MPFAGPQSDAEVSEWVRGLGLPGLIDLHVHFLPKSVMDKVWAFFDDAAAHYGMEWPVQYRLPESERIDLLRSFGVLKYAPLVYPHKPGMAEWLNGWAHEFAEATPDALPTMTFYPEPDVADYVERALRSGAKVAKAHVQVGAYDPRDSLLAKAWGLLADAGVPVIVHCGHGPRRGEHTGLDVFGDVLAAHPELTAVLAHAGMPEFGEAMDLVRTYPNVYLDTTMVGTPFTERDMPLPAEWPAMLADLGERIVLGTDFPNIPYGYATQLRAIAGWAGGDDRLGEPFLRAVLHDTPLRLISR